MAATASPPPPAPQGAASPQPATGPSTMTAAPLKDTEDATALRENGDPSNESRRPASSTPRSDSTEKEECGIDGRDAALPDNEQGAAPPLPGEPVPGSASEPPLPDEPLPQTDDGWDCQWDPNTQSWFFHNRFTGKTQWENPRAPPPSAADSAAVPSSTAATPALAAPASSSPDTASRADAFAGGYNPAIHGDYDPNAWYAQKYTQLDDSPYDPNSAAMTPSLEDDAYASTAAFNRFTGSFQQPGAGPAQHSDEAKSKRQMHAFFDVDAAANADDGRSLKAERSNKRISKAELKAFKEKRRVRKEEKRRAWLRD